MKKLLLTISITACTSVLLAQVGTTPSGTNTIVTTPSGAMPATTLPSGAMPASAMPSGTMPASAVPPTTYPAGTYPPSTTYPAGTVPPAAYPAGTVPPAAYPGGAYPPTTYPAGAYPPSAYPGGAYPPAAYPPSTYPAAGYPAGSYPVGSRANVSPGINNGYTALTSKKGEMILPQAGDWAIGFDATPFLSYLGNFLSSKGNTAPTVSFLNNNQTIIGKYYINDNTAYRGLVRIGFNSYTQSEEISTSDTINTFPIPQVEDQRTITNHFIGLGAGIEKRKGHTRLQGYYGIEFMFYIAGSDTTYKYGNAYNTTSNSTPAYWNWTTKSLSNLAINAPRPTENTPGSTFGINLLGFIGVEYFFAPKISIGGEFTWGIGFQSTGQGSITREEINPMNNADGTNTYTTGGNSSFNMDTGLNQAFGSGSGSLNITFHF